MKKKMIKIGAFVLAAALLGGCSSGKPSQSSSQGKEKAYSNLVDTAAQREVAAALESHSVSKDQTDMLISWANDFNTRVTTTALPEGFVPMKDAGADYQGLVIKNKEAEDGYVYPEANCRLTSFLLAKDMITTNGKAPEDDTFLIFDVEAIDTYEPFKLSHADREKFISLFGWVPLNGADTLDQHVQRIQETWKDRQIQIQGEGISLITVYLHSPFDDVRFVGHTGILLEMEDGLMFVEKYGPQYPFQATRFENREELKQYLLGRKDLYGDETELEPIVMENDRRLA